MVKYIGSKTIIFINQVWLILLVKVVKMWYEKFNWKENPFYISPDPSSFIGMEEIKDSLTQSIKSNNICFIHGKIGSGKSTLLLWLERFGLKDFNVIYINGIEQKYNNEMLEELMLSKRSFIEKLFRRWPKNAVILADECQSFNKEFLEFLKAKFDNKTFNSIILSSADLLEEIQSITGSFKDRIGYKKFELKPLSETELNEMINKRLEGLNNPFNIDTLKIIFEESNYFPRKVLENCQMICEQLEVINPEAVRKLFKKDIEPIIPVSLKITSDSDVLFRLSPLQRDIVKLLAEKPLTRTDIAKALNTNEYSIGSQLSRLQFNDKEHLLTKKGYNAPLIKKLDTKPIKYDLEDMTKRLFAKE